MRDVDLDRRLGALDDIDAPDLWSRAKSATPRDSAPSLGWGRWAVVGTAFVLSLTSLAFLLFAFEGRDHPAGVPRENGPFVVVAFGLEGRPPQYDSLFLVNPDGSAMRRLAGRVGLSQPDWSADGSRIAFVRDGSLWVMDSDGTGQVRLLESADPRIYEAHPSWSPDGTRIAFVRPFDHGIFDTCPTNTGTGVFIMDADGSDPHRITNQGCRGRVAWSPSGESLAILGAGGAITLLAPDGERLRSFPPPGLPRDRIGFGTAGPVWSPDGRLLAFSIQGNIWTLEPTSGHWRQVTRDTGFAITDLDWGAAPPTETTPDPQGMLLVQRNDRASTWEAGVTTSLGVVDPWDIEPIGWFLAFRFDQICYI